MSWTSPLSNKRVAFTGTLVHFTRNGAQDAVTDVGGIPQDKVDGWTQILVVGGTSLGVVGHSGKSRKLRAAEAQGVRIMDEAEFLSCLTEEAWAVNECSPRLAKSRSERITLHEYAA